MVVDSIDGDDRRSDDSTDDDRRSSTGYDSRRY